MAPKVVLEVPAILYNQGDRLSCSATGIPPINIAIMNDSATLVNATNTASIRVYEEGNYTCQASSKYGNDERHFMVNDFKGETGETHLILYFIPFKFIAPLG